MDPVFCHLGNPFTTQHCIININPVNNYQEIAMEDHKPFLKPSETQREALVAFGLAIAAALLIKVPELFGVSLGQNEDFYTSNLSLFVFPLLTGFFAWKRQLDTNTRSWLAGVFAAAILFANIYPFAPSGDTVALAALHLPIALWLPVGIAYAGGRWSKTRVRMDFIRFSGELFIYYVLIALGGVVLTGSLALIYGSIGIDIEPFFESWLLPCGAAGAVIVAAWLVESRQILMEGLASLLAKLFTPLFTLVLLIFLGTLLWTGRGLQLEREVLIAFDLLLVLILGLLIYNVSARDAEAPPGVFDLLQVVMVIGALIVDAVALWAIGTRITELGFTPNWVVALGLNLVLFVNLFWSAVLYMRFLRSIESFSGLEQWQTSYLPVYAAWAAAVVIIIPPLFGYM